MTNGQGKRHGQERDRLLACWNSELGFECTVCGEATVLPKGLCIAGEVWCDGFRADLAAIDETSGEIVGTLEVIDTHEPSEQVLASQEQLAFAYFRYSSKDFFSRRPPLSGLFTGLRDAKRPGQETETGPR